MHLDKDFLIGGIPAKDLRKVLKYTSFSTREFLKRVPDITDNPLGVLEQLLAEGYVIKSMGEDSLYEPTLKGTSLANATMRRYSRKSADKAVWEMMKRIHTINTNQEFAYIVESLSIFGSYITERSDFGDIDIAYKLRDWSLDRTEQDTREKERKQAHKGFFNTFIEELDWPRQEVLRFLKSRSPLIRLHDYEQPKKLKTSFTIVFSRDEPAYQAAFLQERFHCTLQDLLG